LVKFERVELAIRIKATIIYISPPPLNLRYGTTGRDVPGRLFFQVGDNLEVTDLPTKGGPAGAPSPGVGVIHLKNIPAQGPMPRGQVFSPIRSYDTKKPHTNTSITKNLQIKTF